MLNLGMKLLGSSRLAWRWVFPYPEWSAAAVLNLTWRVSPHVKVIVPEEPRGAAPSPTPVQEGGPSWCWPQAVACRACRVPAWYLGFSGPAKELSCPSRPARPWHCSREAPGSRSTELSQISKKGKSSDFAPSEPRSWGTLKCLSEPSLLAPHPGLRSPLAEVSASCDQCPQGREPSVAPLLCR